MSIAASHSRVSTSATVKREYDIPAGGLSSLTENQSIGALETIADVEFPADFKMVNIGDQLGVSAEEAVEYLLKRVGESVEVGEEIASRQRGLGRIMVKSPIKGRIARVEKGMVLVEGETEQTDILAIAPGVTVIVEPRRSVVVETTGVIIQAAWGTGKNIWGTLKVLDEIGKAATPDAERFTIDHRGAIIVIGSPATGALMRAAANVGVKALICSSVRASLIPRLPEEVPLVVTQGFGEAPMDQQLLTLLNTYNGREAAVDMKIQSNWRDIRPEIIIPVASQSMTEHVELRPYFEVGHKVRVLQAPYLGEIGTVTALVDEPQELASGLWSPGAEVEIPAVGTAFVAFANMEQLD
ncbi:MAG: hypothetical protein GYB64_06545 [Chloroflexi bacterium]|nr:hypothetical protein [Chloroflexota bacterium]